VRYTDYFGLDKFARISADNSPRFPTRVIEETNEYTTVFSNWGATLKRWKHTGGVPEFLDFTIKDPDSWRAIKARMTPSSDRIRWDYLKENYAKWRAEGRWIIANLWFGFDVLHAWAAGTERVLVGMVEQPEWIAEMINHWLDVDLVLFEMIWDAGYHFDEVFWYDDMGYKGHQFFSLKTYRELVKPAHKRAVEWAHARGVKTQLHSCGNVNPFVPEFVEFGLDMLNPLEVKAGMDPVALKAKFGDRLGFHGGLNAVLYNEPETLWAEMRRVVPEMKKNGGYIIASDHSVPETVSLEQFRQFVQLAKELGRY
jgi:uroporphyrinogen decarboxylase